MKNKDCGCSDYNPCSQPTPCTTPDCACPVLISSDCVNNVTEDLVCSNILKGQTLTEVLVQLDAYICTKFGSFSNFMSIVNVGSGAEIYKGDSLTGKKQLKTLSGSNLINLVESDNEITIEVDEEALLALIPAADGSETKINPGSNVTITGNGTTATPYVINAAGGVVPTEQDNFVRQLIIYNGDFEYNYTKQDVIDYILELTEEQRTIQEIDSKWNIIVNGVEDFIYQIYELQNIGKGLITELTEDNLLLLYDSDNNITAPNFQQVTDNGYITDNIFYREHDLGEARGLFGIINEGVGIKSYQNIDEIDNDYKSLTFHEENYSGDLFLNYKRYEFGNDDAEGYDRNLLFSLPIKDNPNYPNPDYYTLATTDDLVPYVTYTSRIAQSSTSNPTNTIIENNIGSIVWTRTDIGRYTGTLVGAFPTAKTFVSLTLSSGGAGFTNTCAVSTSINTIEIINVVNSIETDGFAGFLEIKVYN